MNMKRVKVSACHYPLHSPCNRAILHLENIIDCPLINDTQIQNMTVGIHTTFGEVWGWQDFFCFWKKSLVHQLCC